MGEVLSTLLVDVRAGESLRISSALDVSIELVRKSGRLARLRVTAPREVKIEKNLPYCQRQNDEP